jgi:hypothetical protein
MIIVPHPPYSPDLASCNFASFVKLKMKLKGRRFETVPSPELSDTPRIYIYIYICRYVKYKSKDVPMLNYAQSYENVREEVDS